MRFRFLCFFVHRGCFRGLRSFCANTLNLMRICAPSPAGKRGGKLMYGCKNWQFWHFPHFLCFELKSCGWLDWVRKSYLRPFRCCCSRKIVAHCCLCDDSERLYISHCSSLLTEYSLSFFLLSLVVKVKLKLALQRPFGSVRFQPFFCVFIKFFILKFFFVINFDFYWM